MKIRVRVSGQEKLGRLARRLRTAADGELERELKLALVTAAPPVLAQTRAAVLGASFPALVRGKGRHTGSTGLRGRLAAATSTKELNAPVGVRFEVEGSAVVPGNSRAGHSLARYTDTELKPRWRHQVFGRTERPSDWFVQKGQRWFFVSIRAGEPRFVAGLEGVVDKIARRIEG